MFVVFVLALVSESIWIENPVPLCAGLYQEPLRPAGNAADAKAGLASASANASRRIDRACMVVSCGDLSCFM